MANFYQVVQYLSKVVDNKNGQSPQAFMHPSPIDSGDEDKCNTKHTHKYAALFKQIYYVEHLQFQHEKIGYITVNLGSMNLKILKCFI